MPDMWTAIQFDNAVMTFGTWIENKLQERWDGGQLMWSLPDLLYGDEIWYIRQKNQATLDALLKLPKRGAKNGKDRKAATL